MPTLNNLRWELYAQLRAGGTKAREAYDMAGFNGKGKSQSATRLDNHPVVAERITELQSLSAQIPAATQWLHRNYVLDKLREVVEKAMDTKRLGDAVASLRLLGLEVGLFRERTDHVFWDGNPATLTEEQRAQLVGYLEKLEFGGDPKRIAEARRQALIDAGEMVPASLDVVDVGGEAGEDGAPEPFPGV